MDLKYLSLCTGLPVRSLRYVVDHEVVAPKKISCGGRGPVRPRTFHSETAVEIAVAATMLEGGVKRPLVAKLLSNLSAYPRPSMGQEFASAWTYVLLSDADSRLEVGDNQYIRLVASDPSLSDGGWRKIGTLRPPPDDFAPVVIVQVDVSRIRNQVRDA